MANPQWLEALPAGRGADDLPAWLGGRLRFCRVTGGPRDNTAAGSTLRGAARRPHDPHDAHYALGRLGHLGRDGVVEFASGGLRQPRVVPLR